MRIHYDQAGSCARSAVLLVQEQGMMKHTFHINNALRFGVLMVREGTVQCAIDAREQAEAPK